MAEQNGDGRTQAAMQAAQYDAALQQFHAAQEAARNRTLEEHERHLLQYGGGDGDHLSKRAYMLEHGLEYRHGVLVWSPSTVYSEAGRDARLRRKGVENVRTYNAVGADYDAGMLHASRGGVGYAVGGTIAHMPRAPGKMFSRETVCAILWGQYAITHDSHIKDCIAIFERLETP